MPRKKQMRTTIPSPGLFLKLKNILRKPLIILAIVSMVYGAGSYIYFNDNISKSNPTYEQLLLLEPLFKDAKLIKKSPKGCIINVQWSLELPSFPATHIFKNKKLGLYILVNKYYGKNMTMIIELQKTQMRSLLFSDGPCQERRSRQDHNTKKFIPSSIFKGGVEIEKNKSIWIK